jgi:hypothetical protein
MRAPQLLGLSAALLTMALAPVASEAHGPAPAALRVVASDGDGPWLVQLSVGYALRRSDDGGWSYLCPSFWGSAESAPAALAFDDREVLLALPERLAVVDRDAVTRSVAGSALPSSQVLGWSAKAGVVRVLQITPEGRTVWEVTPTEAFEGLALTEDWTGVGHHGPELVLARTDGDRVWLGRQAEPGSPLDVTEALPSGGQDRTATLRSGEDGTFLLLRSATEVDIHELVDAAVTDWGSVPSPSTGPVRLDGRLHLTADAELWTQAEDALETTDQTTACVGGVNDLRWICHEGALHHLAAGADPIGDLLFTLEQLDGWLPPTGADELTTQQCELSWLDLVDHAGLPPVEEPVATEPTTTASGCAMAGFPGRSQDGRLTMVCLLALMLRRRRYERQRRRRGTCVAPQCILSPQT